MAVKYIFVTGGVVSGLGKGITAASLGRLLKARGYKVTMQKFDPYLNVDPANMSPLQHGEVFVTGDGGEADLDLGHYERFIDENLSIDSDVTSGRIYWNLLTRERRGEFGGGTVQVIPHVTNEIKSKIFSVGAQSGADIVITEIGGTIGDMEGLPYIEAIRQVSTDVGKENCLYVHVTLVPYLSMSGEQKSKPTQHSVKELLGFGIQPDVVVCRSEIPLSDEFKSKTALFCNLRSDAVIENLDASILYEVPLMLEKAGLGKVACEKLGLTKEPPDLTEWKDMVYRATHLSKSVKVGLVGKYVALFDAYLSVVEALKHAGIQNDTDVEIKWIDSEALTEDSLEASLSDCDAIIVPAGYGERGTEGMVLAAGYARRNNVPFFGIGMGMQMAAVEFARNVLGLADSYSAEQKENAENCVVDIIPECKSQAGTVVPMRLGNKKTSLSKDSKAYAIYNEEIINERHRHRYKVNTDYADAFKKAGLVISGVSPEDGVAEVIEIPEHKWFIGTQFNPEFKSRPNRAHPLFADFIKTTVEK